MIRWWTQKGTYAWHFKWLLSVAYDTLRSRNNLWYLDKQKLLLIQSMITFDVKWINHWFEGQVKIPENKRIQTTETRLLRKKSILINCPMPESTKILVGIKKYFKNFLSHSSRSISLNIKNVVFDWSALHFVFFTPRPDALINIQNLCVHNRRAYCSHVKLIKLNNELWWAIFHLYVHLSSRRMKIEAT